MKIIHSAKVSENTDVFSDILTLYAPKGATIVDGTFGRGMFWKRVYRLDLKIITCDNSYGQPDLRCDFRKLPLAESTVDLLVLDPPYAVTKSPTHSRGKCSLGFAYGLSGGNESNIHSTDADNVRLYLEGAREAHRVLRKGRFLVLKTQDNALFWKHIKLMEIEGFVCEDLFIVVNPRPPVWDKRWKVQHHSRKNHSYFIVLRKI